MRELLSLGLMEAEKAIAAGIEEARAQVAEQHAEHPALLGGQANLDPVGAHPLDRQGRRVVHHCATSA